ICYHFSSKSDYIYLFARYDTRNEWWFRGELIWLFEKLGLRFSLEEQVDGDYLDFVLYIDNQKHLMELKVMSVGKRSLRAYFGKSGPILKDFERLMKKLERYKWVLTFAYPIDIESWRNQVKIVEEQNTSVKCFKDFVINLKPLEKACVVSLWNVK
ncbi:MAG: hypothetical protein DRN49_07150, partial [Thaumarchaeota archaeon]